MLQLPTLRIAIAAIILHMFASPHATAQPINEDFILVASDAAANHRFGTSVAVSGTTAIVGAIGNDAGSAYIIDTVTGEELFKLTADDAAIGDNFGQSAAISGNIAIIGAWGDDDAGDNSGSVYLFDTTTGKQLFKLTASDATTGDNFGYAVAISGNTAIVGSWQDDDAGSSSGSAYLFNTTTGEQLFKLTATDADIGDNFGNSVAISGTKAIVGAYLDDNTGLDSGSAYLFDIETGLQITKFLAFDAADGDNFGNSVAISENTVIVGAYRDNGVGALSGSVYWYDTETRLQVAKITGNDNASGDQFGRSVAISGNTLIVGAWGDDDSSSSSSGSAYLFDVSEHQQITKLNASDAFRFDQFGNSVAISGNTAIVGAWSNDDAGLESGSAYLFVDIELGLPAPSINEEIKIEPNVFGNFGRAIAISGNTSIVGAPFSNDPGNNAGSAYIYETTSGKQLHKLLALDGAPDDIFGVTVAISGNTAIIGAPRDDDMGKDSGSAYLFDVLTGEQRFKITATNGSDGDSFGNSVAISGSTAIVGARGNSSLGAFSGSAYLFNVNTGEQLYQLTPSVGSDGIQFGVSVAISGTTAIVGEFRDDDSLIDTGSAYLFDIETGEQLFKITAADQVKDENFGLAVAIAGNTAIVGAPNITATGSPSGSAYLFDVKTGEQLYRILSSDASNGDQFGRSVAISGANAIVGAFRDDDAGTNSGSAYLFDVTTGTQIVKLTASDESANTWFGFSVALSNTTAAVGSPLSESAYFFDTPNYCPADINADRVLNFFDLSQFVIYYLSNNLIADYTEDGTLNYFDVSAFLQLYLAGCP